MTFGEKLRTARLALNLTQVELAQKAGIGVRALHNYEQDAVVPRQKGLERIAKALNVSIGYLLYDDKSGAQTKSDIEMFYANAKQGYGTKGVRQARKVIEQAAALFAGGELDEQAKEIFFQTITELFMKSKSEASEKFSPKSRASKPKEKRRLP